MLGSVVVVGVVLLLSVFTSALLNVHVIPHSHCDAGWLITEEQYYSLEVDEILTSITDTLQQNPNARFNWAETIWFNMWWPKQTAAKQEQVRKMVKSGQLEFINGGWVMNDETVSHYMDIIDQTTEGHLYLQKILGDAARVKHGWQIDMFSGYSSQTPALWALAGYDASVLRFEGPDWMRDQWNDKREYEYMWWGSPNLNPNEGEQMMHCIEMNYGSFGGKGFLWEGENSPPITPSTVADRAAVFANLTLQMATRYRSNQLMVTWGADFEFSDARAQFGNMSRLLDYVNQHPELGVSARISTLSEYFDALYAEPVVFPLLEYQDFEYGWPHKVGDFKGMTYQTGALTSRPLFKQQLRRSSELLRAADLAFALSFAYFPTVQPEPVFYANLTTARRAVSLVQHHDSLAGTMATEFTHISWGKHWQNSTRFCDPICDTKVLEDYRWQLRRGDHAVSHVLDRSLASLTVAGSKQSSPPSFTTDPWTVIRANKTSTVAIVLFNPLAWSRTDVVTVLGYQSYSYQLVDANGNQVSFDKQPIALSPELAELSWVVTLPPLGYVTYFISAKGTPEMNEQVELLSAQAETASAAASTEKQHNIGDIRTMENSVYTVGYDYPSCELQWIKNKQSGLTVNLTATFWHYINGTGGAYIMFQPNPPQPLGPAVGGCKVTNSGLQTFAQYKYPSTNGLLSVRIRLWLTGDPLVDGFVDFLADPITVNTDRELVLRLNTNLKTRSIFYHDENGRDLYPVQYNDTLPVEGNYRPMVSSSLLRGPVKGGTPGINAEVAVITSQSMGVVGGQRDGELELMLHRRTLADDSQGPWPLNDTDPMAVPLRLMIDTQEQVETNRPIQIARMQNPVRVVFGLADSRKDWLSKYSPVLKPLLAGLPRNVHLLTLKAIDGDTADMILRLEHIGEKDTPLGTQVQVDLDKLFAPPLSIQAVEEWTLTMQQPSSSVVRRKWRYEPPTKPIAQPQPKIEMDSRVVTLTSMQIRTFRIKLRG